MLIYLNKFSSVSHANHVLKRINQAIGTTYVPTGETVDEIITSFWQIQSARRFTDCGRPAKLSLEINEELLAVRYCSTRGTRVHFHVEFDSSMQELHCWVKVWIPNDRCHPGRTHYDRMTQILYLGEDPQL